MKVLSAAQMRLLERLSIESDNVTSLDLMERAARAITDAICRRWESSHRFVVFAGPGNNGGDALAVSRMMVTAGYNVEVFLFNVKNALSPDCETNRKRLMAMAEDKKTGGRLVFHEIQRGFDFPELRQTDIILDGLFGTGLSRPLDGGFASLVKAVNAAGNAVVAIDIPSGLMSEENSYNDTARIIRATLTLAIHRPKPSHLMPENEPFVGELAVLPIGLSEEKEAQITSTFNISEREQMAALVHSRPRYAHKGMMGHALLMAGSKGMAGAAIMAAKACLRGGVGKVTVCTSAVNVLPLQVSVPEAIVQISGGIIDEQSLATYQAIGMGPGMGTEDMGSVMLRVMRSVQSPLVLDADALTLIGQHREWLERVPAGTVLTPHVGELERIIGHHKDGWVRLQHACELARTYGLNVLVKGHYSAVIKANGEVWFNPTGNPGMATAGSGDVLTGLVTALLAQGYETSDALRLAVWVHGRAGDIAVERVGCEEALIATDIIDAIGDAIGELKDGGRKAGGAGTIVPCTETASRA